MSSDNRIATDAVEAEPSATAGLGDPAAAGYDNESLPRVIDRYAVLERIGEGGFGVIYAAYDPTLDRKVALKLLRAARRGSTEQARLLREAKAMARVTHANVVTVFDAGLHENRVLVAMEFVVGKTLRVWMREGGATIARTLEMFTLAGRGLQAAHARGLVHRDFKPSNVLVAEDGRVAVADFGLAQVASEP